MGTQISTQQIWMQKPQGGFKYKTGLVWVQMGFRELKGTAKPRANLHYHPLLVNKTAKGIVREAGCSATAGLSPTPSTGLAGATTSRLSRFQAFSQVRGWN